MSMAAFGDSGSARYPTLGTWATGGQMDGESMAHHTVWRALLY